MEFCVNASFDQLRALLGDAVAGLHTMVDEHFGISVVEYMAAGEGGGVAPHAPRPCAGCLVQGWGLRGRVRKLCAPLPLRSAGRAWEGRRWVAVAASTHP